jgi:hypothetical protein
MILDLPNGYRFFIFDNPLEQGRCQIHLIFDMENRNLLNLITKNKFSIFSRIGCRDQPSVRVGRNDPVRIVGPGKKVPVAFGTFYTFWMKNTAGVVFGENRVSWQPSCIRWSG